MLGAFYLIQKIHNNSLFLSFHMWEIIVIYNSNNNYFNFRNPPFFSTSKIVASYLIDRQNQCVLFCFNITVVIIITHSMCNLRLVSIIRHSCSFNIGVYNKKMERVDFIFFVHSQFFLILP